MAIIAVTGMIGSGKDEVSRYIARKYSFHIIDYSGIFTGLLKKMNLPPTRENKARLRKERGNTFVAEMVVKMLKERNWKHVVLTSVRRPEDYLIPKKAFPEIKLIVVKADDKIRFSRLLKRGRDPPKNWEDFLKQDKREEEMFDLKKTFSYADYEIENNSSLGGLHKEIDRVMKKIL